MFQNEVWLTIYSRYVCSYSRTYTQPTNHTYVVRFTLGKLTKLHAYIQCLDVVLFVLLFVSFDVLCYRMSAHSHTQHSYSHTCTLYGGRKKSWCVSLYVHSYDSRSSQHTYNKHQNFVLQVLSWTEGRLLFCCTHLNADISNVPFVQNTHTHTHFVHRLFGFGVCWYLRTAANVIAVYFSFFPF